MEASSQQQISNHLNNAPIAPALHSPSHRQGPTTNGTNHSTNPNRGYNCSIGSRIETGNINMRIAHQHPMKKRYDSSFDLIEAVSPPPQPSLSRSSSFGSILDWDIPMMNTTPLPLHPKPTVLANNNTTADDSNNKYTASTTSHPKPTVLANNNTTANDSNNKYTASTTSQSETSLSSKSFQYDFAPLPFNESSDFDGNTLSFLTSISNSNTNGYTNSSRPRNGSFSTINGNLLTMPSMSVPSFQTAQQHGKRKATPNDNEKDKQSDATRVTAVPTYEPEKVSRIQKEPYLSNALTRSTTTSVQAKRSRSIEIAASLLHNTCKLFPTSLSVIESAVQFDPDAIHTAIPTLCSTKHIPGTSVSHDFNKSIQPHQHSPTSSTAAIRNFYSFPLNIALQNNASMDVLTFLLQLYPDVLSKLDGPNQTGSLSIALSSVQSEEAEPSTSVKTPATSIGMTGGSRMDELVRMFVMANPDCVKVIDRRHNTVLHYLAKRHGDISCETISMVYRLYPEALNKRNCFGQTPVQVAQRNLNITDKLLDHWYECSYREPEMTLEKSLIAIDNELDVSNQKALSMDFGPTHDTSWGGCGSDSTTCANKTATTTTTTKIASSTTATKAANAAAYFVPSVLSSSKQNYEPRR